MITPVSITPEAIKEIKDILRDKGIPTNYGLRLGVKGGGCGVSFKLGFDHEKEGDTTYVVDGIQVLIQKKETMFLIGKRVSFYDEADGRGFLFEEEG